MTSVVTGSVIAAILVWILLFALLKSGLAWRIAIDKPNPRSLHVGVVPRVGGLAVIGIALVAMSIVAPSVQLVTVTAVGLMLLFAVDDRRGLQVTTRLLAQLIAATVATYALLPSAPWWFLAPIVVAIIWSMNLYNFMDGADGLAGGMTLFGFAAFAIAAANAGAGELAAACGCIAGAAAGFLLHNFPPAKVFLGDAGSVPLGFLAAALGIAGWAQQVWPLWFPLLVFSPFVVDATVTLVRRALAGQKVWEGHREHLYQRMVTHGWGHARTAVAWYGMMVLVGASAITAVRWPNRWQIVLLIGWTALYAALHAVVSRLTASRNDET